MLFQYVWNLTNFILGCLWTCGPRTCWTYRKTCDHRTDRKVNVWKLQFYCFYCVVKYADCHDEQLLSNYLSKYIQIIFFSLFEILQTLYWAIFGLVDLSHAELQGKHEFTEFVGKLMFGSYSFLAFIVLLNLLIAMMSSSYINISVSKVWLWLTAIFFWFSINVFSTVSLCFYL